MIDADTKDYISVADYIHVFHDLNITSRRIVGECPSAEMEMATLEQDIDPWLEMPPCLQLRHLQKSQKKSRNIRNGEDMIGM